ncbi:MULTISPECIES: pyroglutamyl peptidase [Streptomyces]|uniref:pyroglutamyl peptidase n=1 Tax=Streptomyces TaxID=1883 RepID=UPI00081B1281|nr:Pyrrolidone-carboxylate peptidase (N-terminal pyroglutamyl peptidase) [Streptomyces sp. SolWspMP-5a-2]
MRSTRPTRRGRVRRTGALCLTLFACVALTLADGIPAATALPQADSTTVTAEELRLDRPVPTEILSRSGFDTVAPAFAAALQQAQSYAAAETTVTQQGGALWQRAVDRAQGKTPLTGDLSKEDDRPLYWARLGMTRALRRWQPSFALSDAERTTLLKKLETYSRGQDVMWFEPLPPNQPWKLHRVLLTGFDPFQLDSDIRNSNPSGSAALAFDGKLFLSSQGHFFRVEAATFPVRWRDFADGMVEKTLAEPVSSPLRSADVFVTVSQGRVGRFDLERYNGAWRGGAPDNENTASTGVVPVDDPSTQPQWSWSTLGYPQILQSAQGTFPVYSNTTVTEIPAGGTQAVSRQGPPSPGSAARAGGGGDFLSNEIAYRATLLRDRLGYDKPGGHVHTPVLQFGSGSAVTDATLVRNRQNIMDQLLKIIDIAVDAPAVCGKPSCP